MKTGPFSRQALGIALAACVWAPPAASASDVVILLSKENRIYQRVVKGLTGRLTGGHDVLVLDGSPDAVLRAAQGKSPRVLVAVGDEAARLAVSRWRGTPIVLAGVISTQIEETGLRGVPAAYLDVPLASRLEVLKGYLPNARTVGLLYSTPANRAAAEALAAEAPRLGLVIWSAEVGQERDVASALRRFGQSIDVFLLTFDPVLMTSETFEYLIQYSLSRQVPVAVPATALLASGGAFSVEADYEELGAQAAQLAAAAAEGGAAKRGVPPAKWSVGLNLKMTKMLGIPISIDMYRRADHVHE